MNTTRHDHTDVLIIGGGAVGVCIAYDLVRAGLSVRLLERGPRLASGASAGNAGIVSSSHSVPIATPAALRAGLRWMLKPDSPFYIPPRPGLARWVVGFVRACTPSRVAPASALQRLLTEEGLRRHAEYAKSLDTGFRGEGLVDAYETEEGMELGRREVDARRREGLLGEVLDTAGLRARVPALTPQLVGGALYPRDGYCDPLRFVLALGRAAQEAGVRVELDTEVLAIGREGRTVGPLVTTRGTFAADQVVLAAGAWSPQLTRPLGVSLPVVGAKGYHVDYERRDGDPDVPIYMQEAKVVATPLGDRLRLAGTLELTGLDMHVNGPRVEAIRRVGERLLPGLIGRPVVDVWRGLRPCAPDGMAVIGRPRGLENLVLATGHSMSGITLAPATAVLVQQLVLGREPDLDVRLLDPGRFSRPLATPV